MRKHFTTLALILACSTAHPIVPFGMVKAPRDPYWGNVVLLLSFDGSNGSTTLTDAKGHTITAAGDAAISTAQSVFGGGSISLDGTGDYVTIATAGDLVIGTQDFTIEFWLRTSDTSSSFFSNGIGNVGNYWFGFDGNDKASFWTASAGNNSAADVGSGSSFKHIAISRVSGTTRMFISGNLENTWADSTDFNLSNTIYIGRDFTGGAYDMAGYVDEVRFTIGVGRYTSSFIAPSGAFPRY